MAVAGAKITIDKIEVHTTQFLFTSFVVFLLTRYPCLP